MNFLNKSLEFILLIYFYCWIVIYLIKIYKKNIRKYNFNAILRLFFVTIIFQIMLLFKFFDINEQSRGNLNIIFI